ncbi:MAG: hypothetical protein QM784_38880 [Polyangiaceae bacterium]
MPQSAVGWLGSSKKQSNACSNSEGLVRRASGRRPILEGSLRDQLYRARLLGAPGLMLALPSLEGITSRIGALDADDSATLRWWMGCTRTFPVRLYLDVSDCMLGVYLEPVTLAEALRSSRASELGGSRQVVAEWVDSKSSPSAPPDDDAVESTKEVSLGEADEEIDLHRSPTLPPSGSADAECLSALAMTCCDASALDDTDASSQALCRSDVATTADERAELMEEPCPFPSFTEPAQDTFTEPAQDTFAEPAQDTFAEPAQDTFAEPARDTFATELSPRELAEEEPSSEASDTSLVDDGHGAERAVLESEGLPDTTDGAAAPGREQPADHRTATSAPADAESAGVDTEALGDLPRARARFERAPNTTAAIQTDCTTTTANSLTSMAAPETPIAHSPYHPTRPLNVEAPNAWRHWMQKLDAARGPKPLNAIEQLFINAYVPLNDAYHRGIAGPEAGAVLESWSTSFARSYSEAFDAMRMRGRRPMMVLDIPEAAQRLARLHGARSVQLVLVDGMRFDVGARVENHLVCAMGQQATLTDRFLLWSALPSTTAQQLELIARGAEGLKNGDIHSETPVLVARGRQASTLRRVRAGSRELLKLDLVEARLGEPGGPVAQRLDQLAIEISDALSSAFARLAPRTLVAVFGDHGFCLDTTDSGSSSLKQGGATPDEVLVPGFAWLVGQTH